jgi:hypothetical protein
MRSAGLPASWPLPKERLAAESACLSIEPKLFSFVLVDFRASRPVLDEASDIDRAAFTAESGEPSIGAYVNFKSAGLFAR